MPSYIHRTVKDIKNEPKLSLFYCLHGCSKTFKTTRGLLEHTHHCEENEDIDEEPEDMYLDEETTVCDKINQYELELNLVKHFIKTKELQSLQDSSGEIIREHIITKLVQSSIENAILFKEFDLKIAGFTIYKFFFGLTDEENKAVKKLWYDRLDNYLNL